MEKTLKELGFIDISDATYNGWYKTYKDYRLFVATKIGEDKWHASILVNKQEITIPLLVDKMWVFGFNEENNGY